MKCNQSCPGFELVSPCPFPASVHLYLFGKMVRVFTNGLVDQGSIPGQVISKTQKMVLDAFFLNTQHYKVWIKGKSSNPGKGVAPSPTPWCSNYWKGSQQSAINMRCDQKVLKLKLKNFLNLKFVWWCVLSNLYNKLMISSQSQFKKRIMIIFTRI